jgi:hypothetical protein
VTTAAVARSRPSYGDLERERGLIAVAMANGNTHQAARDLSSDGLKISQKTLWKWRREETQRYEELRSQWLPKIREVAAEQHMALASRQIELSASLTEDLAKKRGDLDGRDISTAIRNVTVSAGVHTDKAQLLSGEPTAIVRRDLGEVLRNLKAHGLAALSEESVIDAEVVEECTST